MMCVDRQTRPLVLFNLAWLGLESEIEGGLEMKRRSPLNLGEHFGLASLFPPCLPGQERRRWLGNLQLTACWLQCAKKTLWLRSEDVRAMAGA